MRKEGDKNRERCVSDLRGWMDTRSRRKKEQQRERKRESDCSIMPIIHLFLYRYSCPIIHFFVGRSLGLHPIDCCLSPFFWYTLTLSMRYFAGNVLQKPEFIPHWPSVVLQSYSVQPQGGLGNPQLVDIAGNRIGVRGWVSEWVITMVAGEAKTSWCWCKVCKWYLLSIVKRVIMNAFWMWT